MALFVYAPIGLLFDGAELLPQLVERGRIQVTMARVVGRYAVERGRVEVTKAADRLQDQAAGVLDLVGGSLLPTAPDEPTPPPPAPAAPPAPGAGAAPRARRHRSRPSTRPSSPSRTTTASRRPRSSTGWPGWRPTSWRRSAPTRRPGGAARRSSPRSHSSRAPDGRRGGGPARGRRRPPQGGRAGRGGRGGASGRTRRCRVGPARGSPCPLPPGARAAARGRRPPRGRGHRRRGGHGLRRRPPRGAGRRRAPRRRHRPLHRGRVPRARDRRGDDGVAGRLVQRRPAASGSTAWPCPAIATPRTSSSPSAWSPAPSWCTAPCRDPDRWAWEPWSSTTTACCSCAAAGGRRKGSGRYLEARSSTARR